MTATQRRLDALEAVGGKSATGLDLDALNDGDLAELEGIASLVGTLTAGGLTRDEAMRVLPTANLRFLASIGVT